MSFLFNINIVLNLSNSLSVKRSSSEASPPVQGLHPSSKRLKVSRMDNKENEIIIQAPAPYPTRSERDPRCLIPCVHGIIGDTRQTESICTEVCINCNVIIIISHHHPPGCVTRLDSVTLGLCRRVF